MRASSFLNWKTALVVASVPFVAAWFQGASSNASGGDMASADVPSAAAAAAASGADTSTSASTDPTNATVATDAPDASDMAPTSPMPAPPGMKLYGGTQEVVKLAQAGVSDDVILTYITNANVRFGVTSDQIIYLNDLGVSGTVVTAMMQHDVTANATSAVTPPPAMATSTPPPGVDYANPPMPTAYDNGMSNLPPDNMNYTDSGMPYPGDNGAADDTDYFYSPLQPYGTWIYVQGYGTCWQPTVCLRDHAWRPYCDRGRWLYSDCGWYWQSDYSWGWAAFHYGRWFCNGSHGWCWQPNRVWGPSWVAWRQSYDHCGWAPLPPSAVFVPGAGFRFHNQAVSASFNFGMPASMFMFIPIERFGDYAPSRYAAAPPLAARIFGESQMLNSVASQDQRVANLGMDPRLVDARAGVRMRRVLIQETPGTDANGRVQPDHLGRQGGSLVIYRPQLPSAPDRHGNGPSGGGAGAGMPGPNNHAPAGGGTRTSLNASPGMPARTPAVLGTSGVAAMQPATGADGGSHLRVYYPTHDESKPAVTQPVTGADGGSHVRVYYATHDEPKPAMTQNNNYRPASSSGYSAAQGAAGQNESQTARTPRVIGSGSGAGYQQYGNPYYHTPAVAAATPGPGTSYNPQGFNNRQSGYGQIPESSYRPAPQPGGNYSAPSPRQNYNAPQPRETYSAPPPQQTYTAPAPQQSYSAPAQSSSYSSHSSSSSSQQQSQSSSSSSSSSGSQRGR